MTVFWSRTAFWNEWKRQRSISILWKHPLFTRIYNIDARSEKPMRVLTFQNYFVLHFNYRKQTFLLWWTLVHALSAENKVRHAWLWKKYENKSQNVGFITTPVCVEHVRRERDINLDVDEHIQTICYRLSHLRSCSLCTVLDCGWKLLTTVAGETMTSCCCCFRLQ